MERRRHVRWRWVGTGLGLFFLFLATPTLDGPDIAGGAGTAGSPSPVTANLPWGLERIRVPAAWQVTMGSPEIVVAVIDSGIDWTVPELAAVRWTNPHEIPTNGIDDDGNGYVDDVFGWDFRDGVPADRRRTPLYWHGTFVAGIIAARAGVEGAAGVAPTVRIMDVRFLDSRGLFLTRDWDRLAEAIRYAVDNGARIINLSLYARGIPPAVVERALSYAAAQGVVVVGIAGNEANPEVLYPGKYPTVLAVSATDATDGLAPFSSWGPEVAVAAPGHEVASLLPGGRAARNSGTSFAAPHVAGTIALILSADPSLTASEAVDILLESSTPLAEGCDPRFGAGLVDAGAAVATASAAGR